MRRAVATDELFASDRRTMGVDNEAKRARDMRKYPFWARGAGWCIETAPLLPAPRKILRDSPTRRDTPQ